MKITEENLHQIKEIVLRQMKDENGRGEFDKETDLRHAINTVIDWLEEKEVI